MLAMGERDRLIRQQDLVMELASKVLGATSVEKAVQLLVAATYKVAPSAKRSFLLCWGGPAGLLVCVGGHRPQTALPSMWDVCLLHARFKWQGDR